MLHGYRPLYSLHKNRQHIRRQKMLTQNLILQIVSQIITKKKKEKSNWINER